jgi:hypothetical protein
MTLAENIGRNTGNRTINTLQAVQAVASSAKEAFARAQIIGVGLAVSEARWLIDRTFSVKGDLMFGTDFDRVGCEPIKPGVAFVGRLVGFNPEFQYLDPQLDIQVDRTLALHFINPEVLDPYEARAERIKNMVLEVPILSITACILS